MYEEVGYEGRYLRFRPVDLVGCGFRPVLCVSHAETKADLGWESLQSRQYM